MLLSNLCCDLLGEGEAESEVIAAPHEPEGDAHDCEVWGDRE